MREVIRFLQKNNFILTFLICEIISLALLVRSNDYQRDVSNSFVNGVQVGVYQTTANIKHYFQLHEINKELSDENAMLRKMLKSSFRNYEVDSASYDTLLAYYDTLRKNDTLADTIHNPNIYKFYPAEVIYNSTQYSNNKILIDKGRIDGIKEGMGVISTNSIVGVIVKVSDHYSSIMPVLHSNFRLGVKPKDLNEYGIAYWDGKDFKTGSVRDFPSHAKLRKDDIIVTSGRSKMFPPGIPIGVVKSVNNNEGSGVLNVEIKFIDDYRSLTNVYVVDHIFSSEIDTLMQ